MKAFSILALAIAILSLQCTQEENHKFLIEGNQVGNLKKTHTLEEIGDVFSNDSVVVDSVAFSMGGAVRKVDVFEKGGARLLTLIPSEDSLKTIQHIRVWDSRYHTSEGVGLNSTFGDIKDHYHIRKIVTSMNNVVIFIKESDLYFTISKEELPSSLRYASSTNIEAVQIPDKARIKYMMIGWGS